MHEAIAGVGLKALQAVAESKGVNLSVGDIKAEDIAPPAITDAEGPQPLDVASRVVAHIFHRVPGVRKIEKRLEGRDKSSGILSDIGTLCAQLYVRNEGLINSAIGDTVFSKVNGTPSVSPTHLDFGQVSPVNENNNGGNE